MKLRPFKELVGMTKDKINEAMAPVRAKQVRGKAEMKMFEIEAKLLTLETQVHEMCVEKEIDFDKMIDKLDEIGILERRQKQYGVILDQLFPPEKKARD